MIIIKRNGSKEPFDKRKICAAIDKANVAANMAANTASGAVAVMPAGEFKTELTDEEIACIADTIEKSAKASAGPLTVEEIQEMVETQLMKCGAYETAKRYIRYRYVRNLARAARTTDDRIFDLIGPSSDIGAAEVGAAVRADGDSGNELMINSIQRDFMAGIVSTDLTERVLLPENIIQAQQQGALYFHDSDYFVQHMHNSTMIDLEDMLQNGTVISETMIWKCHSFTNACNIATQILAQVASNQYGGMAISVTHLVPFVEISRQNILHDVTEEFDMAGVHPEEKIVAEAVEKRLHEEIRRGVQTLQYQVVTLLTTNGKPPFIAFYLYLDEAKDEKEKHDLALIIEEMLKQRLTGIKNEAGVWVDPLYPSFVYVLSEDNARAGSPYYYLTELSARCTAKRQTPDYISDKVLGTIPYGRFDQGVVTMNLADAALETRKREAEKSGSDTDWKKAGILKKSVREEAFFEVLDERMELARRALELRSRRLAGTLSDAAPILWQHGAIARLGKGETIDQLLKAGRSTLSLGYAGLWECVYALKGQKLTLPEGKEFGMKILQHMQGELDQWSREDDRSYMLVGTVRNHDKVDICEYFAKSMQKRWGIIPGVSDKNQLTPSYLVKANEKVKEEAKLALENEFLARFGGSPIIETALSDIQQNQAKVLKLLEKVYEGSMQLRLTGKGNYCRVCGYEGPIDLITDEDEKLVWACPVCGNRDRNKLSIKAEIGGFTPISEETY